jgi:hypothetical protein
MKKHGKVLLGAWESRDAGVAAFSMSRRACLAEVREAR